LGGKPVNIWRFDFRCSVAAQVTKPKIIGNHENDVWLRELGFFSKSGGERRGSRSGEKDGEGCFHISFL
jgi:hypothetical protein